MILRSFWIGGSITRPKLTCVDCLLFENIQVLWKISIQIPVKAQQRYLFDLLAIRVCFTTKREKRTTTELWSTCERILKKIREYLNFVLAVCVRRKFSPKNPGTKTNVAYYNNYWFLGRVWQATCVVNPEFPSDFSGKTLHQPCNWEFVQ